MGRRRMRGTRHFERVGQLTPFASYTAVLADGRAAADLAPASYTTVFADGAASEGVRCAWADACGVGSMI